MPPERVQSAPRFIPAYAGNTRNSLPEMRKQAVHPRVCGEHEDLYREEHYSPGSSPRMRGTQRGPIRRRCRIRFIPAYAGNTFLTPFESGRASVHPRVCGEHSEACQEATQTIGSSPRMRGTHLPRLIVCSFGRFIPAYAGNTGKSACRARPRAVHPRVCGEHSTRSRKIRTIPGSSPRMRGTPPNSNRVSIASRFIPAYAGNTGPPS